MDSDPVVGQIESTGIDEHAALMGPWDAEVNQLSSGRFHSSLQFVRTGGATVYEERWLRSGEVRGKLPEAYADHVLIGTTCAWKTSDTQWCGQTLGSQRFACCSDGSEIDFINPDNSHAAILLVKKGMLASAIGWEASDRLRRSRFVEFAEADGLQLLGTITRTVQEHLKSPELLSRPFQARLLQSELLTTLERCLAHGNAAADIDREASTAKLRLAVDCAIACKGWITALELATTAGASQRALEYAFRKALGMTPGAYLRLLRLNHAHRALAAADPNVATVSTISAKWGFYHPGRFSALHRRHFGERPVEVLRRSRPSPLHFPNEIVTD